jgi:hypothetical protein
LFLKLGRVLHIPLGFRGILQENIVKVREYAEHLLHVDVLTGTFPVSLLIEEVNKPVCDTFTLLT